MQQEFRHGSVNFPRRLQSTERARQNVDGPYWPEELASRRGVPAARYLFWQSVPPIRLWTRLGNSHDGLSYASGFVKPVHSSTSAARFGRFV